MEASLEAAFVAPIVALNAGNLKQVRSAYCPEDFDLFLYILPSLHEIVLIAFT
jgi:hypothetical protein